MDAGPLLCPLHENSAEKIHNRIQTLLNNLRSYPVSFYNATTGAYGEVDYSLVKSALFRTLYSPYSLAKPLISALAGLERGNLEPIYELSAMKEVGKLITGSCACPATGGDLSSKSSVYDVLSIACGDGDLVTDDVDTLKKYYDDLSSSSIFAEAWWLHLGCA